MNMDDTIAKKSLAKNTLTSCYISIQFFTHCYILYHLNTDHDHYSNIYKLKRHIVSNRVQKKEKKIIVKNRVIRD